MRASGGDGSQQGDNGGGGGAGSNAAGVKPVDDGTPQNAAGGGGGAAGRIRINSDSGGLHVDGQAIISPSASAGSCSGLCSTGTVSVQ